MELLHTFRLKAWHSPTAVARIALVLSRRRLRAQELRATVASDPGYDDIEVTVRGCDATAELLHKQFSRVVEVVAVEHIEGPPASRPLVRSDRIDIPFAAGVRR